MVFKYVEYKDRTAYGETDIVKGIFEVIEENDKFIKIKTSKNIITIPFRRIEKIKEKL